MGTTSQTTIEPTCDMLIDQNKRIEEENGEYTELGRKCFGTAEIVLGGEFYMCMDCYRHYKPETNRPDKFGYITFPPTGSVKHWHQTVKDYFKRRLQRG